MSRSISVINNDRDRFKPGRIQLDWNDREFIQLVTLSIRKMTSFLNDFDISFRHRMAVLSSKMSELEKKLDYVESRIESSVE